MDRIYDIVLIITCLSLGSICGFVLGLIYSKEKEELLEATYYMIMSAFPEELEGFFSIISEMP